MFKEIIVKGAAFILVLATGLAIAQGQTVDLKKDMKDKLLGASIEQIKADREIFNFARNKGASAFARNCTRCHGSEGKGTPGIPALNDKAWLWGGDFESIYWTIQFGIRDENGLARESSMPDFSAGPILTEAEALDLANFVLALNDDPDFESKTGENFSFLCSRCHGPYGGGLKGFGAPSLVDDTWIYGNSVEEIQNQILFARHGVMPAWEEILEPEVVKSLAVYVHSLGGGVED